MGKYLPWSLNIALLGCLAAVLACAVVSADTPTNGIDNYHCCRPNCAKLGLL